MIDVEKRNFSSKDPYFDNRFEFNKNNVSIERYKSSKYDDFRYSVSYRMNRSSQNDYNVYYRYRSRSRENYRINKIYDDKLISNSYINNRRFHNYSEKRYLLEYPPPEFERSRSFNYHTSYEYDMEFDTYNKDYYESNIYTEYSGLIDDVTNKENIESKMTLMVDNSRSRNNRVNSLLGDGPEHLRIYPSKYEHFEEDIYPMDTKLTTDEINKNNKYNEKLNISVSTSSEHNFLSISNCDENKISVFDYNHQDRVGAINLEISSSCNSVNYFGKCNISRNIYSGCFTDDVEKTKSISNLSQNQSMGNVNLNDSLNAKWILIPLDAPLRVSISADNINLAKCSKKDPRIEHVV